MLIFADHGQKKLKQFKSYSYNNTLWTKYDYRSIYKYMWE